MASSSDTNSDLKEVSDTEDEKEEEVVKGDEEHEERILPKEVPLKSRAAKVKRSAAPKRKAEPAKTRGTEMISNSIKTKSKSKTILRVANKGKMPEASDKKAFTTKEMIINAVSHLNDKKGSSTVAIRKYVTNKYGISQQRVPRITKLLKSAAEEGWLVQTSGTGASAGSYFKLPVVLKKEIIKTDKKKTKTTELTKKKLPEKSIQTKSNKVSQALKKKTIVPAKKKKI